MSPAISGNGQAIGIGPTITNRWRQRGQVARNPQGPDSPFDPTEPTEKKRIHRGGSFLCIDLYCTRSMVGTRGKGEIRTGSNHVGFRCVKSATQPDSAGGAGKINCCWTAGKTVSCNPKI